MDEMDYLVELPDAIRIEEEILTAVTILKAARLATTGLTCDLCV